MPCLSRCLLAALALLAGEVGRAAAYEANTIYVKLDLDPVLRGPTDTDQALKQAAQEIIQSIRTPLYFRFFSWRLEAKEPSDVQSFPELRIVVREDLALDNWFMHVLLKTGNTPQDFAVEFPTQPHPLLNPVDLPAGNFPPEGRERIERVRAWFLHHFVRQADAGLLHEHMRDHMPLARAHFRPVALKALATRQAVVFLPYDDYKHLGSSEFRLVCPKEMQLIEKAPFRGKGGYHEVALDKRTLKALLIEYEGMGDLDGLTEGVVYLKKYRPAPVIPDSPLLIHNQ